jgi:hypothetical protein
MPVIVFTEAVWPNAQGTSAAQHAIHIDNRFIIPTPQKAEGSAMPRLTQVV